ncbi:MAG: MASE1 domain-containing protein [Novosphingobium sp.]|nr:MASE1 domain-containing protein [Novosphingobium sp.]
MLLILLGLFVFVSAWGGIELTREGGRIASLWLANAGAVAFLLRRPNATSWDMLAAIFLANVAANVTAGDTPLLAIGLAVCNLIEITLAVILQVRTQAMFVSLGRSGGLARLVLFAGICAPAVSALCAATFLSVSNDADFESVVWRWFLADSMGMITLAPMLVALRPATLRELVESSRWFELTVLATLALLTTVLVFSQPAYPILFAIFPVLMFIAFRVRFVGTTMAVTLVATISTVLTIRGNGPIAAAIPGMADRITFLQVFLGTVALTTLPVAAVLYERTKLQRKLLKASREAREAARAKSEFLATMSHEIRTPMTGVLGMIELLRSNPGEVDRKRFFYSLQQSANLLMTVLDDILDYSKLDSGRVEFEHIEFDLRHLAKATIDLFHETASRKGLTLELDYPSEFTAVRGDPVRLQQIMGNLISNAIKFTDVGRIDLRIEARRVAGGRISATFAISDTGMGIAPEQIERLFSPFVQADASTNRRFGGTGLGLAISRRLVEALGGTLSVESIPGLGSTFSYTIGLERGKPIEAGAIPDCQTSPQRPLSILLAEDNPVNRLLVTTLVRRMGHVIEAVENGLLAVEAASARRYDVILMDMQMPEMDGITATRTIRATERGAKLPIIALTADASPDRRRFYDNAGLSGFLTKPVDSVILRDRLDRIAAQLPRATAAALPVFDPMRLAELTEAIGPEKVEELRQMLAGDLAARRARVLKLGEGASFAALRAELHSLRGAAASIGAVRLAAAIETAEAIGERPAELRVALAVFAEAADDTLAEIAPLKPGGSERSGDCSGMNREQMTA